MNRFDRRWVPVLLGLSCSIMGGMAGCQEEPQATIRFTTPRIWLGMYGDPDEVYATMRTEGPTIERNLTVGGTGTVYLGDRKILVKEDGIRIGDVLIESRPAGVRNAILKKNGEVEKDRFLPFESWYHPNLLGL